MRQFIKVFAVINAIIWLWNMIIATITISANFWELFFCLIMFTASIWLYESQQEDPEQ